MRGLMRTSASAGNAAQWKEAVARAPANRRTREFRPLTRRSELLRRWTTSKLDARRIVNCISLSRIPIAMTFVLVFQKNQLLFFLSAALITLALLTDILDGLVARKLHVASIRGRLWDSLGDKALYTGVIISFNSQGFLSPVLCWGLLVREIALYVTRVLYIENLPMVERIRPFTNWHGYFMYVVIGLGLVSMYSEIHGRDLDLYLYTQIAGILALLFGVASIIHFQRLKRGN
jgi:phosphatidylglycerophosphate synthase